MFRSHCVAETENKLKGKKAHSNNAREFLVMPKDLRLRGIVLKTSSCFSPQSSRLSERLSRTLLGKVRSMLKESGEDHRCCGEAVEHATYLNNRTEWIALQKPTQFEI